MLQCLLAAILLVMVYGVHAIDKIAEYSEDITPVATSIEVENQTAGDYPKMQREQLQPVGAIQHAWDDNDGHQGVYSINFNSQQAIKIRAREFMNTTIVFPSWEQITNVEIGDMSAFSYTQPDANKIVLWPQQIVGIDTNITLIGASGHVYPVYARIEGYNSKHKSDLVVHVRVPSAKKAIAINKSNNPASAKTKKSIVNNDYLDEIAFNPAELNFNYSMAGDEIIAPERVYSDSRHTWFDYGDKIIKEDNIPTIFVVVDGIDQPVDVFREGNKLVAQTTGKFTLQQGKKIVCVYQTQQGGNSG